MFVTNWISTTKIQKISEITNFFRHYFLSRTEVKYAKDEIKARDERNNYPQKMVGQIEATVEYFRNKGILEENKVVYAIVSFPMLDNYNAWFDQNLIHEALAKHRIIVRATNQAKILSKQVIQL